MTVHDFNLYTKQVVATDQDREKNGEISYSITRGDAHQQFHIDPITGWISVNGKLDRESIRSYLLEILALDNGIPQRSGSVVVYIDVTDANDNAPVFTELNHTLYVQVCKLHFLYIAISLHVFMYVLLWCRYFAVICEFSIIIFKDDKKINHLVHQFEVTDRDDTDRDDRSYHNGRPFIFEIRSGNANNAFRITDSGELKTAIKFNHKLRNHYRLQIGVYDSGNPPLYSETWLEIKVSIDQLGTLIYHYLITKFDVKMLIYIMYYE